MKKKSFFALMAFIALIFASCGNRVEQTAVYDNVIPTPVQVVLDENTPGFHLTGSTVIAYPAGDSVLLTDASHLHEYILQLTGLDLKITDSDVEKDVIRLQTTLTSDNPEAYVLTVGSDIIDINGASAAGTFYGIQTLRKSIPSAEKSNVTFPAATITDEPRFGYRGAMFDVARHFFPADSVKKFIDMIALHNINTLHWHLTDDQGWRVEIKSRPGLTEVGSKRPGTVIGHNTQDYDSIPVEGFYTQDEIRDIVKYAADRHITIVPEIDLPGHMLGALSAYPYLGCTGGPYEVWQRWGVSEDLLCAGNDSTYRFIEDVLGEIADLFPSEYIHIGGDECPKVRWQECPKCQAKIAELGIVADSHGTKEEKLQSHITHHAADFLASKGKKIIGWDEILEGGAAPGAVVMSWRGEEGGIAAAQSGHDAIMTPCPYLYFDYYQTRDLDNEPMAIGGYIPLDRVYFYEPVPSALSEEEAKHIIGVQANLWTEYIADFPYAQYMELPRMAALSEIQWSNAPKDYKAFLQRLPQLFNHYKANDLRFSLHAFDILGSASIDTDNSAVLYELTTADDAPVYYTLDGSEPSDQSDLYNGPISLTESTRLRAKALRDGGFNSEFTDSVTFSKATARPITLQYAPDQRYALSGSHALVDGKFGKPGLRSGNWMGFHGDDLVAVIDLGSVQQISNVSFNTCISTSEHVFDAESVSVSVSDNGSDWREVAKDSYDTLTVDTEDMASHSISFDPVDTRYVKVSIECLKSIPQWHPAKGLKSFIFVDELSIN